MMLRRPSVSPTNVTRAWIALALALLGFAAAAAPSPLVEDPPVLGKLFELVDEDGRPFSRLEASGIAYYRDALVVVDDTVNSLFVFDREGGLRHRVGSERFPLDQAKFEDLSLASESDRFLAIGSHSGRDASELDRLSLLVGFQLDERFRIAPDSVRFFPLRQSFARLGLWHPGGMKIEGLAIVSEEGGSRNDLLDVLYIGLREPNDRARVYRLRLDALARMEAGGAEPPALPEKVWDFDAGGVGRTPYCISGLLWASGLGGLVISTSTEDSETHAFLGNRLFIARPGAEPELLCDRFDVGMKAEGLAIGAGNLYIVYDNDQDDTGIGAHLRVIPLSLFRDLRRPLE